MIRVVLDTNILVSALLFAGEMSLIAESWKKRLFVPFFSRVTFDEFKKVLSYPKFSLTVQEITALIESEVLPFFEAVEIKEEILNVCRDPADDPFLSCAVAAGADYIISGDRDLLDLGSFRGIPIVTAIFFLQKLKIEDN